jgi:hypothetical protein
LSILSNIAHAQSKPPRNRCYVAREPYVDALAAVFETCPEVIRAVSITEYSYFAGCHGALAVTRTNAIYLRGPGAEFLVDPELTLHEYYHVLRQWNPGHLSVARYIGEWIRRGFSYARIDYEVQARDFARHNVHRYLSLLEQR